MNILRPNVTDFVSGTLNNLKRYKVVIFALLMTGVYGYVIVNISSFANAQPTPEQVALQTSPIKSTKIDKKIVAQLQHLQDNSVNVKTLFDEARNNPFQEN